MEGVEEAVSARTIVVALFAAFFATLAVAGETLNWQHRRIVGWVYIPNPPSLSEVWWHWPLIFAGIFVVLKLNRDFLRR